ncbi:MAG TPA: asparagine synthase-related protein [Gemmatimonadaceae bacterium]|nr:asparagine synthase-related protein [Gemmatimonadaceae bacterium]
MSGLLLAFGDAVPARRQLLMARAQRLRAPNRLDRVESHAAAGFFACAINSPATAAVASDASAALVLYGALHRDGAADAGGDAAYALERFRRAGVDGLCNLDGSFVLALAEQATSGGAAARLTLVADRIGSIPCYWRVDADGTLLAATECKCLFDDGAVPPVSRLGVLNTLLFGRVKLTRAPLFAGIAPLDPGSTLTMTAGGSPRARTYYVYREREEAETGAAIPAEEGAQVLRRVVAARLARHERVAIGLSGGIDSRMLLAAVDPADYHKVLAVSFGMADNDESMLARHVARTLGVPYRDIELTPAHFVDHAESAVRVSEGQDLFVQGYLSYVTERLARDEGVDAMLDGMEVGVSLGGDYLKDEFADVRADELPGYVFRRFYVHRDPPAAVFLDDAPAAADRLVGDVLAQVADVPSVYHKLDWLYIECYTREVMRLRHRLVRKRLAALPVPADRAYLALVSGVPARRKAGRRFQLEVLARLDARLLDVPYHGTMLPLTVPRARWPEGAETIRRWEALCQDVWRAHRVRVPFAHYYTNFAEWLRADPLVRQLVGDLLLGDDCRITRQFVRRDWLRRIVREHADGEADHRSSILYALGTELFLRQFGDPGD